MDEKIIKFDDTEIQEQEFHQYKSPILINNVDINKKLVSNKFRFRKLKIGFKDNKGIRLYPCSFQKLVYIKDIVIRLNVCIF